VCNEKYAIEIAEGWNAKHDGGGFVTGFALNTEHLQFLQETGGLQ
jgi:hypothetical protein